MSYFWATYSSSNSILKNTWGLEKLAPLENGPKRPLFFHIHISVKWSKLVQSFITDQLHTFFKTQKRTRSNRGIGERFAGCHLWTAWPEVDETWDEWKEKMWPSYQIDVARILRVVVQHVEGDQEPGLLHGKEGCVVPPPHSRARRPRKSCGSRKLECKLCMFTVQ